MSNDQPVPEGKDPALWAIAQKRASFKKHLVTYLIINAFLWTMWYFTSGHRYFNEADVNLWRWNHAFPWPIWTTLGWGIGLAFHFASAYIFPQSHSVESEYEKLSRQRNRQ